MQDEYAWLLEQLPQGRPVPAGGPGHPLDDRGAAGQLLRARAGHGVPGLRQAHREGDRRGRRRERLPASRDGEFDRRARPPVQSRLAASARAGDAKPRSCGAVWSARHPVKVEAAGSNPVRTAVRRKARIPRGCGPSCVPTPRSRTPRRTPSRTRGRACPSTLGRSRVHVRPHACRRSRERHGPARCARPPGGAPPAYRHLHAATCPAPPPADGVASTAPDRPHRAGTARRWRHGGVRARHETRALLRAHLAAASGYRHLTRHCPICHRLLRLAMEPSRTPGRGRTPAACRRARHRPE